MLVHIIIHQLNVDALLFLTMPNRIVPHFFPSIALGVSILHHLSNELPGHVLVFTIFSTYVYYRPHHRIDNTLVDVTLVRFDVWLLLNDKHYNVIIIRIAFFTLGLLLLDPFGHRY
jgi:hypothetical protein